MTTTLAIVRRSLCVFNNSQRTDRNVEKSTNFQPEKALQTFERRNDYNNNIMIKVHVKWRWRRFERIPIFFLLGILAFVLLAILIEMRARTHSHRNLIIYLLTLSEFKLNKQFILFWTMAHFFQATLRSIHHPWPTPASKCIFSHFDWKMYFIVARERLWYQTVKGIQNSCKLRRRTSERTNLWENDINYCVAMNAKSNS